MSCPVQDVGSYFFIISFPRNRLFRSLKILFQGNEITNSHSTPQHSAAQQQETTLAYRGMVRVWPRSWVKSQVRLVAYRVFGRGLVISIPWYSHFSHFMGTK